MEHSTNYRNTLILVSEDCPVSAGKAPDKAGTVVEMQYRMIAESPYALTSDDVVFGVYADRQSIPQNERGEARRAFFSKGQPCLRASPLVKSNGWGVHSDEQGRVALVAMEDPRYAALADDPSVIVLKGMRNSRK